MRTNAQLIHQLTPKEEFARGAMQVISGLLPRCSLGASLTLIPHSRPFILGHVSDNKDPRRGERYQLVVKVTSVAVEPVILTTSEGGSIVGTLITVALGQNAWLHPGCEC